MELNLLSLLSTEPVSETQHTADAIAAEPAFYGKEKDIDLLFRLLERYQEELREKAVPLAERIYEEKPRDFSRRSAAWRGAGRGAARA